MITFIEQFVAKVGKLINRTYPLVDEVCSNICSFLSMSQRSFTTYYFLTMTEEAAHIELVAYLHSLNTTSFSCTISLNHCRPHN